MFEVTEEAVNQLLHTFNANHIIHGHTHKPFTHTVTDEQFRYVLGSWNEQGGIIGKYSEDQGFHLIPSQK